MPNAPRRFNPSGRKPAQQKPWRTTQGTNKERGYSTDWNKLRNAYIAQNPLCERCEEQGKVTPAREVNHIIPFDKQNTDDPLRLDWNNLESVCTSCHRSREQERKKGIKPTMKGTLHIVTGAPGSGKSTWVSQQKQPNDLVFDFDLIAHAMGAAMHEIPEHFARPIEDLRLSILEHSRNSRFNTWVIHSDLIKAINLGSIYGGRLKIINTDAETCINRLRQDSRPRLDERISKVREWWSQYEKYRG